MPAFEYAPAPESASIVDIQSSYGIFVKEGALWKVDKIYDFPSADDSND